MSEQDKQLDNPEQDSYETGSTRPPKSSSGLVAVLLVLVILLFGAASYLGMMNVRLVLQIKQDGPGTQIQFLPPATTVSEPDDVADNILPGVEGRTVSTPEQAFYHWPAGVVVTKVLPDSDAAEASVMMGDIITAVNGKLVEDLSDLNAVTKNLKPGAKVTVTCCRDGENYYTFECIWE